MGAPQLRIVGRKTPRPSTTPLQMQRLIVLMPKRDIHFDKLGMIAHAAQRHFHLHRGFSTTMLPIGMAIPRITVFQPDAILLLPQEDTNDQWVKKLRAWTARHKNVKYVATSSMLRLTKRPA